MDCRVCVAAGDLLVRLGAGVAQIGGFSHESEHDLAMMVSDFLENGSVGAESWCSSDSDSGFSDLPLVAEKISLYKHSVDRYESDLLSVVHSSMLSMDESELNFVRSGSGSCNTSCIRFSLVKRLRLLGYDAAVCSSRWQGCSKVPGGDHEYIDVVDCKDTERLIIDIDFHSHFEIARAVESYDRLLNSLPVIYVGSLTKLKQYLQVMVEAARSSLKQNSMPLPPWRSLEYLETKWKSSYQRQFNSEEQSVTKNSIPSDHKQCSGHLKRLQHALQLEVEADRLLKPINNDNNWRLKPGRRRHSSLRTL